MMVRPILTENDQRSEATQLGTHGHDQSPDRQVGVGACREALAFSRGPLPRRRGSDLNRDVLCARLFMGN